MTTSTENKFAVVGMGGIFPDADNVERFWENILAKKVSIEPLPQDCVERDVFYRPEVHGLTDKKDRSYTDRWATIKRIEFEAGKFPIPPKVVSSMDDNQKLSLLVAKQALAFEGLKSVANDRVAVIMGNSMIGQLHHDYVARFNCDKFEYYLKQQNVFVERLSPQEQEQLLSGVRKKIVGNAPCVTEDTAPGVLPNIIAARINSVFDLHGHAYVVDAACASGLAAIICGIQQLRLHEVDAVICGAVDMQNREVGRIYFSGIGALSAEGSFPFDERANGFVAGDGAGAIIIKRLEDAIVARDRIFGIISGYGQASDGKGKAIAAPNEIWQAKTIRRAWEMAGVSPESIGLIEAHGTSTQVGDLSEVNALKNAFQGLGATRRGYCGLGSVKSNIGHLKSAAGIAGFVKALLAVERKVLPPTAGFTKENPKLKLSESPFYVLSDAREWQAAEHPRRAGVSAFGFGGADYHIAVEEYREQDYSGRERNRSVSYAATKPVTDNATVVAGWPLSLFFSAQQASELLPKVEAFASKLRQSDVSVSDLVIEQNLSASARAPTRLAFPVSSFDDLNAKIEAIRQWQGQPTAKAALLAKGIVLESALPLKSSAVAVLFPGQGSQYPDMLRSVVDRYAASCQIFTRADVLWRSWSNTTVSELIESAVRGTEETDQLLRKTQNTHPALFVSSLAIYRLLEEMGLVPAVMVGHSVGEFTALAASGKLSFKDALALLHARATAFSSVPTGKTGSMLALPCSVEAVATHLSESGVRLAIANVNSPNQTIVSGDSDEAQRLVEYCESRSIKCVRLNVSHAFHSPLMEPAEATFRQALDHAEFRPGNVAVIANGSNEYYTEKSEHAKAELRTQITGSVRFAKSIERLYDDGIRLFVEVGPGSVLSQLVRDTLRGRDVTVLSSDNKRGDSSEAYLRMLCGLFAAGIEIDPTAAALRQSESSAQASSNSGHASADAIRSKATVNVGETLTIVPPVDASKKTIVYSGVSVGLPGSFKASFRDDNFEQLFEGRNLIERLTDEERQRLVDLRVSKVVKSEQGASFATLSALNEVIQLAGKLGHLELERDYFINEKDIATMSTAIAHAVAAGYEALKDAQIPLVHEYTRTSGGSVLPERWALPKEMQRHTGVIFANGFPMLDPIIQEVSRHLSYKLGHRVRQDLLEFYDTLIAKVTDRESRKLLTDWFALNYQRISAVPNQSEVYNFNHQLMTQIAMQANNRFARFINARGPNFQINAACSSTATAVTLAEELIRGGRAKRIIVIGADDPSSEHSLPYLGAGFLSTGACTNVGDLYEAALPFDKRRNGMIMGAGAVGLVIEADSECKRRGVVPVCELMGSHCFNTAGHNSQLDVPRYAEELDMFMTRMESLHGVSRATLSRQLVYVSHETYTPARGGCSEAEAVALRHVFGEDYRSIEISNTKGMTGHTMGASIEDAVAAKALQFGKAPPVVNHRQLDPTLEGLKLGVGAPGDFEYALRMAAGFGSQGNYILLKRCARNDSRIADASKYAKWLTEISGLERARLTQQGRVLVVKDERPGSIVVDRPDVDTRRSTRPSSIHVPLNPVPNLSELEETRELTVPHSTRGTVEPLTFGDEILANRKASNASTSIDAKALVLGVVASITGYATDILELDMELEADLGIDTVKQATVLATLAERMKLSDLSGLRLSEYPTLRSIVVMCDAQLSNRTSSIAPGNTKSERVVTTVDVEEKPSSSSTPTHQVNRQLLLTQVLDVIATVTGYGQEILGEDMEIEADLGIDTVKQATVLSLLGERFGLSRDSEMRMSELTTIRQLVDFFAIKVTTIAGVNNTSQVNPSVNGTPVRELTAKDGLMSSERELERRPVDGQGVSRQALLGQVLEVVSAVTGYDQAILGEDMELEADLGIDTVKQATVLSLLGERLGLVRDTAMRMSELGTIRQLVDFFALNVGNKRSGERDVSDTSGSISERVLGDVEVRAAKENSETKSASNSGRAIVIEKSKSTIPDTLTTITERLYAIVGKVSPYPAEMLESALTVRDDLELSADVQSELLSSLVKAFSLPSDFRYPINASLGHIAELVLKAQSGYDCENSTLVSPLLGGQALGRQVLALRPVSEGSASTFDYTQNRVWVLGDNERVVSTVTQRLNAMNCDVGSLVFPVSGTPTELVTLLERLFELGEPKTIIDLTASPSAGSIRTDDPSVVVPAIERAADCRFFLTKWLVERKSIPERVLAVTAIDGHYGLRRDDTVSVASAIYGLHVGFYKALRKEWTNCFLSILDLDPNDWEKDCSVALQLIERELGIKANGVEICYVSGVRHRLVTEDSSWSLQGTTQPFAKDEVVVMTGGGAGITAQLALELGRKYPVKFALIGRTVLEPTAKGLVVTDDASKVACKALIQQQLTASSVRVTPNLIEQTFARLERSAEIYRTLESLEQFGCIVRYYQADVCDLPALQSVVADIREQLGPITTLVHGAGLEISHRIEQKSLEEFHRVYGVKAIGAYQLDWLCRGEPLRRVVAVSSIASRYGNLAQTDYCAGNAFLDLLMRTERRSGVRALSLLWSGWGQLGMAWRNSFVREHGEQKGLNFIDPESGARAAVSEITATTGPSEVVIHRGLGDVADVELSDCDLSEVPLIDWVEKQNGIVTATHRRFSPKRDAFLNQHRFAGIPYMPGVGFMEMMAETLNLLATPEDGAIVFRKLSFLDGFKLHRDEPRDVRIDVTESTPGLYEMNARSPFKLKMRNDWEVRDYARALLQFRPRTSERITVPTWSLELTEETDYGEIFETAKQRKQNVHLGPLFNDAHRTVAAAKASSVRWGRQGLEALVPLPKAQIDFPGYPIKHFLINPAFLDALHQAGAVLAIQLTNQVYLPVGAEEFVVYEAPKRDETYRVVAKLKTLDDVQATYDMFMTREDGTCCVRLTNSQFRRINA